MGFEDLDDLSELDEMPPFDEDLDVPGFEQERGGISRTFVIIGGILILGVIGVVVLILLLVVNSGGEISARDQTATSIAETNVKIAAEYTETLRSIDLALTASQEAIMTFEANSTATQSSFETQQAIAATEAANLALTQEAVNQTATAEQAARAEEDANATATAIMSRTIRGVLQDKDNNTVSGVPIRLYKDDGDGVFSPVSDTGPALTPVPLSPGGTTATLEPGAPELEMTEPMLITYGQTVDGTLEVGVAGQWTFSGVTGDIVNITATANDPAMDMFVALTDTAGNVLISDDDTGEGTDAAILGFPLPADGAYIIQVSSAAGPGPYTLNLTSGTAPAATEEPVSYVPRSAGESLGAMNILAQGGEGSPTPTGEEGLPAPTSEEGLAAPFQEPSPTLEISTATPPPPTGDLFLLEQITGPGGEFDFGALEPGTYFLVIRYEDLPQQLREQVPAAEEVLITVEVPVTGPITFTIGALPQPTISFEDINNTQTAIALQTIGVVTLTSTGEGTPLVMPTSGFFSDISDSASELEGSSGLAILAIAAVGLVAVVFVARKLRTAA